MKIAIARLLPLIRDMEKIGIHPFNMVHDELDFEAEPHVARDVFRAMMSKVRRIMEQANPWPDIIPMPVDVTFGQNWAECK
jgi:DNA polymerase I-like protein with 3'-5' exonuclease and polymerase domains